MCVRVCGCVCIRKACCCCRQTGGRMLQNSNSTMWKTLQSNEVGNAEHNKYNTDRAEAAFAKRYTCQSSQTPCSQSVCLCAIVFYILNVYLALCPPFSTLMYSDCGVTMFDCHTHWHHYNYKNIQASKVNKKRSNKNTPFVLFFSVFLLLNRSATCLVC